MTSLTSTTSNQSTGQSSGNRFRLSGSRYVWPIVGLAAIAGGLALAIAVVLCSRHRLQLQLRLRPPSRWLSPSAAGAATTTTTRRVGGTAPLAWTAAAARSQKVMIEMTRALEMLPVHVCPDPEVATPTSDGGGGGGGSSSSSSSNEDGGEANDEGGGESGGSSRRSSGEGCSSPASRCGLDGLWLGECAICLSDFSPGERLRPLPCKHVFHASCIDRWLIGRCATELVQPTCPLCKAVAVRCPSFDANGARADTPQVEMVEAAQVGATAV